MPGRQLRRCAPAPAVALTRCCRRTPRRPGCRSRCWRRWCAPGSARRARAQGPAPVALDEEPDDGLAAARGIAHRDQAAVGRRLVGIDPDVVARAHARGHGVVRDAHDERLAGRNIARPVHRRAVTRPPGARTPEGVLGAGRRRSPCARPSRRRRGRARSGLQASTASRASNRGCPWRVRSRHAGCR